jgi:hypothetical protein
MVDDKFGIKKIFPDKRNGQQWFLGDDAEGDDRFDTRGDNQSGNAKDGFCTSESDFRYHVLTTKGEKDGGKDHDEWRERGYISYPEDWRNVEITIEAKYDGSDDFSVYCRAWRHTGSGNCEGTKYSAAFNPDGETRYSKETYHNEGYDFTDWKSTGVKMDNEWVRLKFIVYDVAPKGHKLGELTDMAQLETWVDPDKNNSWKKVNSFLDNGENWGVGGRKCGTEEQAVFLWGGPFVTLRGDSTNKLCYRKFSVREIDVQGDFSGGGGGGPIPGTPNPGEEPPNTPPGTPPEVEPGSVGKDKFGITQFFPSPAGGFQWFADWKSQPVSNVDLGASPPWFKQSDPYFHIEDTAGQHAFISNGELRITCDQEKDYRIEIFDEDDQKRWVNIEATVYYNWDAIDYNDPDQGGKDGIRIGSDHHFPVTQCAYNAHEYIAEIRRDGKIYFNREIVHGTGGGIRPNPDFDKAGSEIWWNDFPTSGKPPLDTWIGFKFIKQLIDGGKNVRLQLYRDITNGVNGGDWKKLMEWKHIEGNWTSDNEETNAKIQTLIDKSHENVNDCRIPPPSQGIDPVHNHSGGMCHLRGDKATSIKFKNLSFREIIDADAPLPTQGIPCSPGFRKNNQGVCVPMDGSGGAGGFGEAGVVYKDFIFVYHIGNTDADTCNISGLFSTSGVDMAYEVTSGDLSYDLHNGFTTNCGIYIASEASRLARVAPKKIVVVLSKFGLPTGPIIIHATNAQGRFRFEFGRIQADLLTTTMEEYQFDILENTIALQWGWTIWISYNGGDPQNFVKVSVKGGDPFDGQNTIAVRYRSTTGREQMADHDIAAIVYR